MSGIKAANYLEFNFSSYCQRAILLNTFFVEQTYLGFITLRMEVTINITLSQSSIIIASFNRDAHKHCSKKI